MSEQVTTLQKSKSRLKFIDMARSMAILLMLEGHFVDDSLSVIYRDPNNPIFTTWQYIRGFTAPVFLTVTGLIFVYLLLRNKEAGYFKNIRIRKGFKRVIELLFWGIIVQFYAFHVLECIAFGILSILTIYGIYRLVVIIPLWIYFLVAGLTVFGLYKYIAVNHGGHTKIENDYIWGVIQVLKPDKTGVYWFPIIPFIGFTMFGAMIGALLHDLKNHIRNWYFPTSAFVIGALWYFFPKEILGGIDDLLAMDYKFISSDWLFLKLGMVFMVLSVLIYIDNLWGHKIREGNLFLKVGQNTLTIYVLHMMVLYGSLTSFGLNDLFNKRSGMYTLNPWGVAIGAILFVLFFVFLIKYLDWIKEKLSFVLDPIKKFFNKVFFVG